MSLVNRAINLLKSPKTEWDVITAEQATTGGLFTGYAIPLSLLSAAASFVGTALIGSPLAALGLHFGMTYYIGTTFLGWVLGLVGIFIAAYIVNMLAENFGSTKNSLNALKLVVYAYTESWVGGLLLVIPYLGMFGSIAGGIFSVYLFYLGLPKLMNTPQDKVVGYMVVSALIMIVIMAVIGLVVGSLGTLLFMTAAATSVHY